MIEAASDYPLGGVLWSMLVFFSWMLWIWLLITVFGDLFSRSDIGGWGKAGWTAVVLVLPFLGTFSYLITQSKQMVERRTARAYEAQAGFDSYVRSVSASSGPVNEIGQAKELLDSGAISPTEFEAIKRKALTS